MPYKGKTREGQQKITQRKTTTPLATKGAAADETKKATSAQNLKIIKRDCQRGGVCAVGGAATPRPPSAALLAQLLAELINFISHLIWLLKVIFPNL